MVMANLGKLPNSLNCTILMIRNSLTFVLLIITVTQYNPNLQMIRGRTSLNYNGKFSSPAVTLGVFRSFSPVPPPSYSSQTLPLCLFQVFMIMMMAVNDEDGSDAVIIRGSDGNCHWSFCELEPGHMVDLVQTLDGDP